MAAAPKPCLGHVCWYVCLNALPAACGNELGLIDHCLHLPMLARHGRFEGTMRSPPEAEAGAGEQNA